MNSTEQHYVSTLQGLALLMDKLPGNVKRTFTNLLDAANRHDSRRLLHLLSDEDQLYFIKSSVYLSMVTQVSLPSSIEQSFMNPAIQQFMNAVSSELASYDVIEKKTVSAVVDSVIIDFDMSELIDIAARAFFLMNNPLIVSSSLTASLYIIVFIEMLIFINQQ